MKVLAALVSQVLLAASAAGAEIPVDWKVGPFYSDGMTATVGDTIVFTWEGTHDVHIHPSGDCDFEGRIEVGLESPATYTVTEPGFITFSCDVYGGVHCENGQIVTFTVSDPLEATGEAPVDETPKETVNEEDEEAVSEGGKEAVVETDEETGEESRDDTPDGDTPDDTSDGSTPDDTSDSTPDDTSDGGTPGDTSDGTPDEAGDTTDEKDPDPPADDKDPDPPADDSAAVAFGVGALASLVAPALAALV